MDVSIIIVNYNTKKLLADCINSIYKHTTNIEFEIIVSDNGSVDGSIEMLKQNFPQVILIENNANLGFGTANNKGLSIAKGKYIFYLNSDTLLLNNAVKLFFDYFEENGSKENIGALGCNLLNKDGTINNSYSTFPDINQDLQGLFKLNFGLWKKLLKKIFISSSINNNTSSTPSVSNNMKKTGEVDYIVGADLFLLNNEYALFDENFFLYFEETDLQYQLAKAGKKRILLDEPSIIHYEGCSSNTFNKNNSKEFINFSSKCLKISTIYYYKKNISKIKAFIIKILTLFLWLNPLLIRYNLKSIPILLRTHIREKDIDILKGNK